MKVWRPTTAHQARKDETWAPLLAEIEALSCLPELETWWGELIRNRLRDLPTIWSEPLEDAVAVRRSELIAAAQSRSLDLAFARAMERDQ